VKCLSDVRQHDDEQTRRANQQQPPADCHIVPPSSFILVGSSCWRSGSSGRA
jgi:hypothetical protein